MSHLYIATAFNYHNNNRIPLVTLVIDKDKGKFDVYDLYHQGTGLPLMKVEENKNKIRDIFLNNKVICNDFKTHLYAFDMDLDVDYDVYDPCIKRPSIQPTKPLTVKKLCSTMKELQAHEPSIWSSLVAKSSVPYQYLENKGYLYFNKKVNPIFYLNTFTGRTKSVGFSIHGKGEKDEMRSVDIERTVFIHFDWVSADMRFGAIMSDDDIMMETFKESDPYSYISDATNLDREVIKKNLLKASYNKDFDDWIFEMYKKYANWMANNSKIIAAGGTVCNIVGRPFKIDEEHDEKSVISAPLQGSVASAIHAVTSRIYKLDKNILFTDIYDSIVCACSKGVVMDVVKEVGNIMYRPFEGILKDDLTMPYKVSMGNEWRKWREAKALCRT